MLINGCKHSTLFRETMNDMSHEDRMTTEQHLQELAERDKPPKKTGFLSRIRESSQTRKELTLSHFSF